MQMTRGTAIVCVLAALPGFGSVAWAQQVEMVGTVGKPPLAATIEATWPTVLKPTAPSDPSAQPPAQWSAKDVEEGRARCAALLEGLDLIAVPAEPIREGDACGTPAPMQLVSIGSSPKITFSPPATLNCEMILAMHTWLQRDVQPLARKHLGTPITGVKTMSSFSCRTAYSRARARLSEHGRVNAIDIGGFVTAQGEAQVIADWGPVSREVTTRAAEAKAEAVKRQAEAAAVARKGGKPQEGTRLASPAPEPRKSYQAGTSIPMQLPKITFGLHTSGDDATDLSAGLGWAPPSRLGGPKPIDVVATPALATGKTAFLHDIHKAACAIFTTVLGPEANKYHNNHFHLDLAERKSANICE